MAEPEVNGAPFTKATDEALRRVASRTWETYEPDGDVIPVPNEREIAVSIAIGILKMRSAS